MPALQGPVRPPRPPRPAFRVTGERVRTAASGRARPTPPTAPCDPADLPRAPGPAPPPVPGGRRLDPAAAGQDDRSRNRPAIIAAWMRRPAPTWRGWRRCGSSPFSRPGRGVRLSPGQSRPSPMSSRMPPARGCEPVETEGCSGSAGRPQPDPGRRAAAPSPWRWCASRASSCPRRRCAPRDQVGAVDLLEDVPRGAGHDRVEEGLIVVEAGSSVRQTSSGIRAHSSRQTSIPAWSPPTSSPRRTSSAATCGGPPDAASAWRASAASRRRRCPPRPPAGRGRLAGPPRGRRGCRRGSARWPWAVPEACRTRWARSVGRAVAEPAPRHRVPTQYGHVRRGRPRGPVHRQCTPPGAAHASGRGPSPGAVGPRPPAGTGPAAGRPRRTPGARCAQPLGQPGRPYRNRTGPGVGDQMAVGVPNRRRGSPSQTRPAASAPPRPAAGRRRPPCRGRPGRRAAVVAARPGAAVRRRPPGRRRAAARGPTPRRAAPSVKTAVPASRAARP